MYLEPLVITKAWSRVSSPDNVKNLEVTPFFCTKTPVTSAKPSKCVPKAKAEEEPGLFG